MSICKNCGHSQASHIYEEGACRPGFVCGCSKFVPTPPEERPHVAGDAGELSPLEKRADKYCESLENTDCSPMDVALGFIAGAESERAALVELLGDAVGTLKDAEHSLLYTDEKAWARGSIEMIREMLARIDAAINERALLGGKGGES